MCDLCKNKTPRTLTHSRTRGHLKLLFILMKERQLNGYYKIKTKR
jgi:hypothetical protein